MEDGWHDAAPLIRSLGIKQPPGFEFEVSGVPTRPDQVQLWEGCTLVVRLEPCPAGNFEELASSSSHHPDPTVTSGNVTESRNPDAKWHTPRASGAELHHALEIDAQVPIAERPPPHAPLPPILTRQVPEGPPPPDFISANFLVLAPRYTAEVIALVLRAPCAVNDAMQEVTDARDTDDALRCDYLFLPAWQPDLSFAVLLALPGWAENLCGALIDSRSFNGCLYHCVLPPSLLCSALFGYIGIEANPDLRIYVNGQHTDHNQVLDIEQGSVISVVPPGRRAPIMHALDTMLASSRHWVQPCPVFSGPAEAAFMLLADAGHKVLTFTTANIPSPEGFRALAVQVFQYHIERTSFCVAEPRIRNCTQSGQTCDAVVIATEQLSRLPKPPGKLLFQSVVFLDLRPILQDFTWEIVYDGLVNLDRLERHYQHFAPEGFSVVVKGGTTVRCHAGTACFVSQGSILTVEFVLDYLSGSEQSQQGPDDTDPASDDDSDDSSESEDSADTNPGVADPTMHTEPTRGGRSPQNHHPVARSRTPRRHSHEVHFGSSALPVDTAQARPLWFLHCNVPPHGSLDGSLDSSFAFVCCFTSFEVQSHRQHKLLSEPASGNHPSGAWLRDARTAQAHFGQPWPYLRHGEAPRVPLPGDPFFLDVAGPPEPSQLTVAILVPDRQTEIVTVWLFHPVQLAHAIACIQQARNAWATMLYPRLQPVWPQPSRHFATFLALPAWDSPNAVVCIDLQRYDGRVYACALSGVVDRFTILQAAGLWGHGVDIFSPTSQLPIRSDEDIQLLTGHTVSIVSQGQPPAPFLDIDVILMFPMAWRQGIPYQVQTLDDCYCAITEGGHRLFRLPAARAMYYRADFAAFLPCPPQQLVLEPARPRLDDAAVRGWPCRTAVAAASRQSGPTHAPSHLVMIDCRPLLQGWFVTWAPHGLLNARLLQEELEAFAPAGHVVALQGAHPVDGWYRLAPGQWLTAHYVPIADRGAVHPQFRQPPTSSSLPPGPTGATGDVADMPAGRKVMCRIDFQTSALLEGSLAGTPVPLPDMSHLQPLRYSQRRQKRRHSRTQACQLSGAPGVLATLLCALFVASSSCSTGLAAFACTCCLSAVRTSHRHQRTFFVVAVLCVHCPRRSSTFRRGLRTDNTHPAFP